MWYTPWAFQRYESREVKSDDSKKGARSVLWEELRAQTRKLRIQLEYLTSQRMQSV